MTMIRISRIFIVAVLLAWMFPHAAAAQTVQERLISSTFKTLAKTYIAASDFNKLKKNTLSRLDELDTDSFHAKYPRTLQIINDSPVLAKQFGLRGDMSVEQAESFVRSLNKKKVSMIIDAVPDEVLARHVMEDISRKAQAVRSNNIMDQVSAVWRNLQDRLDLTTQRSPS